MAMAARTKFKKSIRPHYSRARRLGYESLEQRQLLAITVDTLVDEADGSIVDGDISLRDAIAAAPASETIDFELSLDGGTLMLTLGELAITEALTIDATSLPSGLTIDASGNDPTPGENRGLDDQPKYHHRQLGPQRWRYSFCVWAHGCL